MLAPEQAQRLTDLRRRMAENIAKDLPPQHGIGEAELSEALSFLRANRTASGSSGGQTKKKKAGAKPKVEINTKDFTEMDLD